MPGSIKEKVQTAAKELNKAIKSEEVEIESGDKDIDQLMNEVKNAVQEQKSMQDQQSTQITEPVEQPGLQEQPQTEKKGELENVEEETETKEVQEPPKKDFKIEEDQKTVKERIETLKQSIADVEHEMVTENSEELGKITELEQRVEKLEIDWQNDLSSRLEEIEKRIGKKENKIQKLKEKTEYLEKELNEENLSDKIQGQIEETGIESKISNLQEEKEENSTYIEEIESKLDLLWDALDEEIERVEKQQKQNNDVEKLWQAFDEEMANVESRIHTNEEDMEEILSMVVELSELVKNKLDNQ